MARRARRGAAAAVLRSDARVMPLELFFDLVFVLAITQCSALMAATDGWRSLVQGVLVLGVLWWAWVGYAWLTSVVDPEEGAVRIVLFVAMAGLLVVALCVPQAFDDLALTLALSYGVVRAAHLALFVLASRGDPNLRRSVTGLAVSTAIGVGLLVGAAFLDGTAQGAMWVAALALDMGGPFLFGSEGWKLEPEHFAERHGLIVIIALGESIVALGVGSEVGIDGGVLTAAVVGMVLAAAMWWMYFDVGALMAGRRLAATPAGKARNEMARDAYSYLHFPMVAAVVLMAVGLEHTLAHVDEHLHSVAAFALMGGLACYLLSLVAFKVRALGLISWPRVITAGVVLALYPVAQAIPALVALVIAAVVAWLLIGYETLRFAELRDEVRHADQQPET